MPPTSADLDRAAALLRGGGLVALPTETVYGLGADARSPTAIARLFAVKHRPADHPVIVHLAGAGQLADWADPVPPAARALAERCWPGPLTIVLRRRPEVLDAVTGGRETVALRVPDQPVALELLRRFAGGIAAPSANRFGQVSPTTAEHVRAGLGEDVDLILDGGPCRVGVESTIVDLSDPSAPLLLREGALGARDLETLLGTAVVVDHGPSRAPGMLAAHYAPAAVVELADDSRDLDVRVARRAALGERVGVIALAGVAPDPPGGAVVLGRPATAQAYAHELYDLLHRADAQALDAVVALPPPGDGIAAAVRDRLRRAAAAGPRA